MWGAIRAGRRAASAVLAKTWRLPGLARLLLALIAVNFVVYAALRMLFWAAFRAASADAPWAEVGRALFLGLRFDLRLALLLCLPLALLGWIPRLDPTRRPAAPTGWIGYFAAAQCLLLLLYFIDFGHYAYERVRLNASVLDHLTPVAVAAQMVWETYPVVPALLGLSLLTAGYAWVLRLAARRATQPYPGVPLSAASRRVALGALALCYLLGLWGAWSRFPLRWSAAYFSPNEAVAALGLNPVLFLVDTAPNRSRPYDRDKVREHYSYVASLLGVEKPDARKLEFARDVRPPATPAAGYNLVMIHMESLAGYKVGVLGNPLGATPHFDAIAREGILFTNFFVPQQPTARSVFTMMTGIPDLNPNRSASRNPLVVNQHTLINALAGYEKYYFLGGSATWGNIRAVLAHNIPDLQIFEEGDYDAPHANTWGVSDLVLFEKAQQTFASAREPFFAFIQTSGNHRPYTIPEDRRGFVPAKVDTTALRAHGFDDLEAYNGLRFLDHSLESFFAPARRAPYFRRTVFVIYGDHGIPSATATDWEKLGLTRKHVPLVIYAPGLSGAPGLIEEGRRIDFTASLTDSLPTCLNLLGVPHLNTGLGRDLLALGPEDPHFSLIGWDGVLDDEFFLRVLPGGVHLYRYRSAAAAVDVHEQHPEKVAELRRLHEALYETARYLPYHNPARRGLRRSPRRSQ